MANLPNSVGNPFNQTIFAVVETTKGLLQFPLATGIEAIVGASFWDINQSPTFTDSPEIKNSRSVTDRFQDMAPAGSWKGDMLLRPSGTAGSVPMGDAILYALFGTRTVNAGTSVVYSPGMTKPGFSLFTKQGHTTRFCFGSSADQCQIKAVNKGGVLLSLSGQFMNMGIAGTDQVAAAAAQAATTVTVKNAKLFSNGAVIWNKSKSDKATNGYTVSNVNTTNNTMTVTPGIVPAGGWAIDDQIEGYLPTPSYIGTPLESRKNVITVLGSPKNLQSLDWTWADKMKFLDDEMTANGYPTESVEDRRTVKSSLAFYFRRVDAAMFADGLAGSTGALSAQFGTVAGKIATLAMPRAQYGVPTVSIPSPTMNLSVDVQALGTNGEDECTLTLT